MLSLKLPFALTRDQIEAVNAWISSGCKGSIIYRTGTGKTEIAFECARRAARLARYKCSTDQNILRTKSHLITL